jgi:hypothetical protein
MGEKPDVGRRRWVIGLPLGAGLLINSLGQVNVSVAAPLGRIEPIPEPDAVTTAPAPA